MLLYVILSLYNLKIMRQIQLFLQIYKTIQIYKDTFSQSADVGSLVWTMDLSGVNILDKRRVRWMRYQRVVVRGCTWEVVLKRTLVLMLQS